MEKPKSKGIFWVLSIIAVIFLVLLVSALEWYSNDDFNIYTFHCNFWLVSRLKEIS